MATIQTYKAGEGETDYESKITTENGDEIIITKDDLIEALGKFKEMFKDKSVEEFMGELSDEGREFMEERLDTGFLTDEELAKPRPFNVPNLTIKPKGNKKSRRKQREN